MKWITSLLIVVLSLQLASCNTLPTEFDVTLKDFKYEPDTITVQAGKEITLHIENDGMVSHRFIIFKLGADVGEKYGPEDEANIYWLVEVLPGSSATAKFIAPSDPGEYYVTCGINGHHEAGMVGKLIVVDQ